MGPFVRMRGRDGEGAEGPAGRQGWTHPNPADALEEPRQHPPAAAARPRFPGGAAPDVGDEFWRRHEARRLIREFLGSVPRSEADAVLSFVNPRGEMRTVTRAQLSARVDRLRPRQRQIVRLGVEERWPRQRVCDYLNHISIKTFERDHMEALDLLAEM